MAQRYSIDAKRMLHRVCSEYLEMPGLCLTRQQAQRLWGLDDRTCGEILTMLQEMGFLHQTHDGRYARVTDGAVGFPLRRMAKARLRPGLVRVARHGH